MKQRITAEQLNELTDKQKQKLWEWWKPELYDFGYDIKEKAPFVRSDLSFPKSKYDYPLLSVGQMIELLESKDDCLNIIKRTDLEGWGYEIQLRHLKYFKFQISELCDALWQAVKEVL